MPRSEHSLTGKALIDDEDLDPNVDAVRGKAKKPGLMERMGKVARENWQAGAVAFIIGACISNIAGTVRMRNQLRRAGARRTVRNRMSADLQRRAGLKTPKMIWADADATTQAKLAQARVHGAQSEEVQALNQKWHKLMEERAIKFSPLKDPFHQNQEDEVYWSYSSTGASFAARLIDEQAVKALSLMGIKDWEAPPEEAEIAYNMQKMVLETLPDDEIPEGKVAALLALENAHEYLTNEYYADANIDLVRYRYEATKDETQR
ncbi:unnamed protein product [Chrysoparadoxa australica]